MRRRCVTSHKMMTWKLWLFQISQANTAQFRPRLPQSVGMPGTFFGVFLLVQSVLLTSKKSSKFWKKRFRAAPKHTITFLHIRSKPPWKQDLVHWQRTLWRNAMFTRSFFHPEQWKKPKNLVGVIYVSDETLPLWSIVALEGNREKKPSGGASIVIVNGVS